MKSLIPKNKKQNIHFNANKPRPENKDDLDSREGEEQLFKKDDITHNKKDTKSTRKNKPKNLILMGDILVLGAGVIKTIGLNKSNTQTALFPDILPVRVYRYPMVLSIEMLVSRFPTLSCGMFVLSVVSVFPFVVFVSLSLLHANKAAITKIKNIFFIF